MAFSEKIRLIFDVDAVGASKNLKGLRSDIANADGAMGKAKAGAAGLGGMLKENIGAAAITAGAAVIAFGVKAVGVFTDTAKAAIDLGDATGLSTQQASKWIAVGDDMEVTAEQLTSGLGKVAKTLDDAKWSEYGISTRDAAGNARDTNDILLDTFAMLGKVTNETERARIGNDLFGKGYANLAPMVGKTRAEYEKMLGSVESGQVITDKEAKKAEKMRLAQDALSDALNEVTLAVGGMAAELAPTIETMAGAIEKAIAWKEALGPLPEMILGITNPVIGFGQAVDAVTNATKFSDMSMNEMLATLDEIGASAQERSLALSQWHAANETVTESTIRLSKEQRDEAAAAKEVSTAMRTLSKDKRDDIAATLDAAKATRDLAAEYNALLDPLNDREAWLNLLDSLDEYAWKMNSGTLSTREAERATIDISQTLIEYLGSLEDVPAKKQTEILAMISAQDYENARAALDALSAPRTVQIRPVGAFDRVGARASGGPVNAGEPYLVGEEGPEVIVPGQSGMVIPNHKLGGGSGGSPAGGVTNVYVQTGADPRQVIEVIKRYQQRGGVV